MDGFCEQVVKKKRTMKDNIMAVVYILLTLGLPALCIALAYVIVAYFIYIGLFVLIAMVPLTIWLISNQKVEFEYQVVDDYLLIDKIVAKRKRKKIIRVKLSEIKDIVKFNEKYTGKKINKYFLCIDEVNNPDAYAFVFYNEARGNCAAVMLPNEKILNGMRPRLLPEMQLKVVKMLREMP